MAEDGEARSRRVLVVDDDDDIRDTLRDVLEDEGYAVSTAGDGHQAMQYLAANASPVVIILDLMMPVKNGWMVLADLAAQPSLSARVQVVVVSAAGSRKLRYIPGTVDTVLEKPVHLPVLMATLRRLLPPTTTQSWPGHQHIAHVGPGDRGYTLRRSQAARVSQARLTRRASAPRRSSSPAAR